MDRDPYVSIISYKEVFIIGIEMTAWMAFGGGVLSFLSPCTLPLLPLYLSYITGKSVSEIKQNKSATFRKTILTHSLVFLLGVSLVYISLGLGVHAVGELLSRVMTGPVSRLLQRLSGLFILFFGLLTAGVLRVPALSKEYRLMKPGKPADYFSTFFVGLGFAAGWTPCIGPIFSAILLMGNSTASSPFLYLSLFVVGFSLPFLLVSLFIGRLQNIMRYSEQLMKIGGFTMIAFGALLLTGSMEWISETIVRLMQNTPFNRLG